MKDLHSHIIYGIDDGAKTLTDSINMLKEANSYGVTDIVLTSHYIKESRYDVEEKTRKKIYTELKKELKKLNLNINLYLGSEIYIDEDIPSLLKNKLASSINNTKYILIEFPLHQKCNILDEALYEIFACGYIPVIAHPERYTYYDGNIEFFEDLVKRGCLLQGNIGSLQKKYGTHAKKMLEKLLKNDLIYCFGSDSHHVGDYEYVKDIEKRLLKIIKDEKRVEDLLENNFNKLVK